MSAGTAARMSSMSFRSVDRSWASRRASTRALTSATLSAADVPSQAAASAARAGTASSVEVSFMPRTLRPSRYGCGSSASPRSVAASAESAEPASARMPRVGWLVSSTRGSASIWIRRPRGSRVK